MKNISLLVFSFLLISCSIFSQKLELTWGELVKSNNHRFLGSNEQYFFAIERLVSGTEFKVYDYDANLVSSKKIKKNLEGDRIYVSKVIRFNEKDFVIFESMETAGDSFSYYYSEITGGILGDDIIELCSIDYQTKKEVVLNGVGINVYSDSEGVRLSKDKRSLIILQKEGSIDPDKDNERFTLIKINEDLKISYQKELSFDCLDNKFSLLDVAFNQNDEPIILAKKWNEDEYDFLIYTESEAGIKSNEFSLDGNNIPGSFNLSVSSNGNIFLAGFYSKLNLPKSKCDGTFFAKFDGGGASLSQSINEFPKIFKDSLIINSEHNWGRRVIKKASDDSSKAGEDIETKKEDVEKVFPHFMSIRYASMNEELNEFKYVSEVIYSFTRTIRGSDGMITYVGYDVSGPAVVVNYNLNGELLWMESIDKNFVSSNSFRKSLIVQEHDSKLHMVFNGRISERDKEELGLEKSGGLKVENCTINALGVEEKRETIYVNNKKDKSIAFQPVSSGISNSGYFILNFALSRNNRWATSKAW